MFCIAKPMINNHAVCPFAGVHICASGCPCMYLCDDFISPTLPIFLACVLVIVGCASYSVRAYHDCRPVQPSRTLLEKSLLPRRADGTGHHARSAPL